MCRTLKFFMEEWIHFHRIITFELRWKRKFRTIFDQMSNISYYTFQYDEWEKWKSIWIQNTNDLASCSNPLYAPQTATWCKMRKPKAFWNELNIFHVNAKFFSHILLQLSQPIRSRREFHTQNWFGIFPFVTFGCSCDICGWCLDPFECCLGDKHND